MGGRSWPQHPKIIRRASGSSYIGKLADRGKNHGAAAAGFLSGDNGVAGMFHVEHGHRVSRETCC